MRKSVVVQQTLGGETTKIGQSRAFKNKWISKEGAGFVKAVCPILPPVSQLPNISRDVVFQVANIDDTTRNELETIHSTGTHPSGEKLLTDLRKRKLITARYVHVTEPGMGRITADERGRVFRKHTRYEISKGSNFSTEVQKLEADLTTEMLTS